MNRDDLWRDLVARTGAGDENALASLYDASSSLVHGIALRVLSDPSAAEEVTLDVFTQIWRTARSFDPQRGSTGAWIAMLARTRAIDRLRQLAPKVRREERIEAAGEMSARDAAPEEIAIASQRRHLLRQALAGLPEEQRKALELGYFRGLSHTDIARELGVPLGTIKTRVRLGMTKLREALAV